MNTGQPETVGLGDGREDRLAVVGARGRWNRAVDQALCIVDEDARRRAGREPHDAAARGIRGRRADVRELHRLRVGDQRVAIDAGEDDRIVRECAGKCVLRRELLGGPEVLVPPPTLDPCTRLHFLRPCLDATDDFVVRRRPDQIDALECISESEQMGVGINDSGNDSRTVKVDDERGRAGESLRLGIRSDELDAAATDGESGRLAPRVVDCVDPPVGEDEIGEPLRFEHGWCERDDRKVG